MSSKGPHDGRLSCGAWAVNPTEARAPLRTLKSMSKTHNRGAAPAGRPLERKKPS